MQSNFDKYASGTKCEFWWQVQFSGSWQPPQGTSGQINWAKCKIGDLYFPDATAKTPYNDLFNQGIRFASNKFAPGPIVIKAEANVTITSPGGGTSTFTVESPPWEVTIYNTLSTVGTKANNGARVDRTKPETWPNPDICYPTINLWPVIYSSKRIVKHAIESIFNPGSNSIHFTRRQNTFQIALDMEEPAIAEDLKRSTVLVHSTHGNFFCFNDSYNVSESGNFPPPPPTGPPYPPFGGVQYPTSGAIMAQWMGWYGDELTPYLATKNSETPPLPPLNLALLWDCSTLSGGAAGVPNHHLPNKFGFSTSSIGQAYCGFIGLVNGGIAHPSKNNDPVSTANEDLTYKPLLAHAERILDKLKNGFTIGEAVDEANQEFLPRETREQSSEAFPNPMRIIGDRDARLVNVYTKQTERTRFPDWRTSWYHIFF